MGLLQKIIRSVTFTGNIGKCPDCEKVQYPEDVPSLMKLEPGAWENVTWKCPHCGCHMKYDEILFISKKG